MTERKRYEIEFSPVAEKAFERLPKSLLARIDKAIGALADEPRPRGVQEVAGDG